MDYINLFILFTSVLSLSVSVIIYLKDRSSLILKRFILLILNATLWSILMIAYRTSYNNDGLYFYTNLLHLAALFLPISFLNLIRAVVKYKYINLVYYVFLILNLIYGLLFIAGLGASSLIDDVYKITSSIEPIIIFNFTPYIFYVLAINFPFLFGFYLLYKEYKKADVLKDESKKVLLFFLAVGVIIPAVISVFTNLLLPFFGYFNLNWVGQLSTSITPLFILYAIYRYKIFNFELFVAEILIFILSVQSFISVLQSKNLSSLIVNIFTLSFIVGLGWWLLQNIKEEKSAKEKLEHKILELNRINEHVRNLTKKKSEFLSIATHQLRSPVAVMKGQMSLIIEGAYGKVPEPFKQPMENIYHAMDQLSDTITDFLNVSRIEQGKMKYNFANINLNELLNDIHSELIPIADSKNISLLLDFCKLITEKKKIYIYADKSKLHHVFYNLIENSIKYTEKGFVKIKVCTTRKYFIRIEIQDTGIGIAKKDIKSLFNKFERAKNVHGINVQGSGLGLYIAREMLHAHNGRIWAHSEGVGKGATFVIELPIVPQK